jgi:hypothetical protein
VAIFRVQALAAVLRTETPYLLRRGAATQSLLARGEPLVFLRMEPEEMVGCPSFAKVALLRPAQVAAAVGPVSNLPPEQSFLGLAAVRAGVQIHFQAAATLAQVARLVIPVLADKGVTAQLHPAQVSQARAAAAAVLVVLASGIGAAARLTGMDRFAAVVLAFSAKAQMALADLFLAVTTASMAAAAQGVLTRTASVLAAVLAAQHITRAAALMLTATGVPVAPVLSVSSGLVDHAAHHHSHQPTSVLLNSEHKTWNTQTSNSISKFATGNRMSILSLRTTSSWPSQTSTSMSFRLTDLLSSSA